MPLFIIEREFAEQLDVDDDQVRSIEGINDDLDVRWIYSFLSADRKKTYCLYEAHERGTGLRGRASSEPAVERGDGGYAAVRPGPCVAQSSAKPDPYARPRSRPRSDSHTRS